MKLIITRPVVLHLKDTHIHYQDSARADDG
jgi:hypothetical protein